MADVGGTLRPPVAPLVVSNKLSTLLLPGTIYHPDQFARPQRRRANVGGQNSTTRPTNKLGNLVRRSSAVEPKRDWNAGIGEETKGLLGRKQTKKEEADVARVGHEGQEEVEDVEGL